MKKRTAVLATILGGVVGATVTANIVEKEVQNKEE